MIDYPFSVTIAGEADIEVCTGTEELAGARDDNHLDPFIEIKHGVNEFKVGHHLIGKGIALLGPIQGDDNDRSGFGGTLWIMRHLDMLDGKCLVRLWDLNFYWISKHGEKVLSRGGREDDVAGSWSIISGLRIEDFVWNTSSSHVWNGIEGIAECRLRLDFPPVPRRF